MRILHTSDWHLGMNFQGIDIRDDQRFFLNQIYQIVENEGIDVVLLAGDVYDHKNVPADAYDMYDEAVTKIVGEFGKKMIVIAGNHDSPERLSTCNKLLSKTGLYVQGVLEKNITKVAIDDVEFYLLPWITTEQVVSQYPGIDEDRITMEKAYQIVLDKMREQFDPDKKHIVISHSFVIGAETSVSDKSAVVGNATVISSSVFEGVDYVALGHIHKPQNITDRIRYCGTPMMYSFGAEETQTKSVTIIDTRDMSVKEIPLQQNHKRFTVTGTYDEIINGQYSDEQKEGYVRLNITDRYVGLESQEELRTLFPHLLELSSKSYDDSDATITMTLEELQQRSSEPLEIIRSFFKDVLKQDLTDDHQIELLKQAISDCNEQEENE